VSANRQASRPAAGWRMRAGLALAALLPACSTGPETPPVPSSVSVPIGTGVTPRTPKDAIYGDILDQCRAAYKDRDAERLADLLGRYDRPDAPDWAREQFGTFRAALAGLKFTLTGLAEHRLVAAPARLAGGETLTVTMSLRSAWPEAVRIPARDGDRRAALLLDVSVRDEDAQGNGASERSNQVHPLEHDLVLPPGGSAAVTITVPTTTGALLRTYEFSGTLMPVQVVAGKEPLNVNRIPLDPATAEVLPPGFPAIARAPLTTLREAVRRGDPEHFGHQYLACVLLDPRDKRQAGDLLAGVLGSGKGAQVTVALGCLRKLFGRPSRVVALGTQAPVVERGDWLEWWRENRERF
jgi:hypothetical protein